MLSCWLLFRALHFTSALKGQHLRRLTQICTSVRAFTSSWSLHLDVTEIGATQQRSVCPLNKNGSDHNKSHVPNLSGVSSQAGRLTWKRLPESLFVFSLEWKLSVEQSICHPVDTFNQSGSRCCEEAVRAEHLLACYLLSCFHRERCL